MKKPDRLYSARGLPLAERRDTPMGECLACGRRRDDYMVKTRTWELAFGIDIERDPSHAAKQLYPQGHLCFECLEARLKRALTLDDFVPDAPINRPIFLGASLARDEVLDRTKERPW